MNKHMSGSGFTLIELMITIAIIGILVAIAVPAFRGYALRAKISEAMIVADLLKSTLGEAFVDEGEAGVIKFANRVNVTDQAKIITNRISSVVINTDPTKFGHITIALGRLRELPSTANEIAYSPYINKQAISETNSIGVMQWVCAGRDGIRAQSIYPGATILTTTGLETHNIPDECR